MAWIVVREPRRNPEAYAAALKQAEAAVQAEPDNGYFINTLGVAQYRMGQYAEALATLTKSDKLNAKKSGSIPADLAFLAMVRHRLGQKEEANALLARLRAYFQDPRHIRDRESRTFLLEAEELIEGETAEK
jgi:Flp pilus assembly protein TadD